MMLLEKFAGFIMLMLGGGAICLMIYSSMKDTLREVEDERVQELAEAKFREMIRHTRFRVVQRMEIKDEMQKGVRR